LPRAEDRHDTAAFQARADALQVGVSLDHIRKYIP
jgi:hypothetical protein